MNTSKFFFHPRTFSYCDVVSTRVVCTMLVLLVLALVTRICAIQWISCVSSSLCVRALFAEFSAQFIFIKMTLWCDFMTSYKWSSDQKCRAPRFYSIQQCALLLEFYFFRLIWCLSKISKRHARSGWHTSEFIHTQNAWCNNKWVSVSFGWNVFKTKWAHTYVTNAEFIQINHDVELYLTGLATTFSASGCC